MLKKIKSYILTTFLVAVVSLLFGAAAYPAETIYLDRDYDVDEAANQMKEALKKGAWEQSLNIAAKLLADDKKVGFLVDVDTEYALPAFEFINKFVAGLPEEQKNAFIKRVEPSAEALLRRAATLADFVNIARRYSLTPSGFKAQIRAAELLAESGDFHSALYWVQRAIDGGRIKPDTDPQLFAMAAFFRAQLGDQAGAQEELKKLKALGDIEVESSGKRWKVASLVKSVSGAIAAIKPLPKVEGKGDLYYPTAKFQEISVPAYYWLHSIPEFFKNPQVGERPLIEQRVSISDGVLYYSNTKSVRAFKLETKKHIWIYGLTEDFKIGPKPKVSPLRRKMGFMLIYPDSSTPEGSMNVLVDGENVICNLGNDFITGQNVYGPMGGKGRRAQKIGPPNTLINKIGPGGELVWTANAPSKEDEAFLKQMIFLNVPVKKDGKLYLTAAALKKIPEIYLVCLDAKTGQLLWKRYLCSQIALGGKPDPRQAFRALWLQMMGGVRADRPSMADDPSPVTDGRYIYAVSGVGCAGAFDMTNGRGVWVYKFPVKANASKLKYRNNNKSWAPNEPVLWKNLMLVASPHSDKIYALDKITGKKVWDYPRGEHLYLLGVYDGKVVISGKAVTALDAATGKVAWTKEGNSEPFGRGCLDNGVVYHPSEKSLAFINATSGALIADRVWDGDMWENAGSVIVTGGRLVVCGYNKITVYDSIVSNRDNPKIPAKK